VASQLSSDATSGISVSECIASGRKLLDRQSEQAKTCSNRLKRQEARIFELEAINRNQYEHIEKHRRSVDSYIGQNKKLKNQTTRQSAEIVTRKTERKALIDSNVHLQQQRTHLCNGLNAINLDLRGLAEGKTGRQAWNRVCVHCMACCWRVLTLTAQYHVKRDCEECLVSENDLLCVLQNANDALIDLNRATAHRLETIGDQEITICRLESEAETRAIKAEEEKISNEERISTLLGQLLSRDNSLAQQQLKAKELSAEVTTKEAQLCAWREYHSKGPVFHGLDALTTPMTDGIIATRSRRRTEDDQ